MATAHPNSSYENDDDDEGDQSQPQFPVFPADDDEEDLNAFPVALHWPAEQRKSSGGDINNYEQIRQIGRGGFGLVFHYQEKSTGRDLAIKLCYKHKMKNKHCEHLVMRERMAMVKLRHRFVIRLLRSFQDEYALYFVMDLMTGNLKDEFTKVGQFRNEVTRFYTAELILALEYLRTVQIIHKDIKMRNILLDQRQHLKLADFGCCVFIEKQDENVSRRQAWRQNRPNIHQKTGTRTSFAPEVILEGPVSYGTDLWGLGCLLFEMHTGEKAFPAWRNLKVIIPQCTHTFFPGDADPCLRDLVSKLLVREADNRLGYTDMTELKMHPFYGTRDPASWEQLHTVEPPPFDPGDPRARTDSTDRPSGNIFFQPSTDQIPNLESSESTLLPGFDTTPEEEDRSEQEVKKSKKKCIIS